MARQSYLIRRGGSYSARMRVPADLVEAIGRKELVKALGTNDPAEAKRRVWAVVESWLRRFDALRNRTAMTEEDRIDLISAHYFGIMERDEQRRAVIPTDAEIDVAMERAVERAQLEEIDVMDPIAALNLTLEVQVLKDQQAGPKSHDAFARRTKLNELRKHLTKGESALVQHEIDAYLDQNGLTIKPGSQEHTSLIRQLIRAEIEALQRTLERDEGNYGGNVQIRDHRFWTPLLMLFSGARPGEIGQLAVSDIRKEHGRWIMHITTEGDGEKRIKTKGSMRVVPLHPMLLRLGFLDYQEAQTRIGNIALFPKAKRNDRGQMMADFSREFGKYLTRIGLKKGKGLSLYSFRHGVADAFRRAGFLDEQFKFLLGHTQGTTTGRYGIMPHGILEQRAQLINAIHYPGLDLSHLCSAN